MNIKTVHTNVGFTIVEYEEDGVRRRTKLPFQTKAKITEEMLSLGLPYGVVWSDAVFPFIMPPDLIAEEIDRNLYNAGIFTREDLENADPNVVFGLLLKSYGIDYQIFRKTIDNYLEA